MATTITVEDDTLERFKQLKSELDDAQQAPAHSSDSFLKCLMDTYEGVQEGHYGEPNDPLTLSEVDEIAEQLAKDITDGATGKQPDESKVAKEVVRRIDYVELSTQVADELEWVMR